MLAFYAEAVVAIGGGTECNPPPHDRQPAFRL